MVEAARPSRDSRERTPLLEREAELRALDDTLARAGEDSGGIAFVEAATGIGKTRLLEEATALAARRGMAVLTAHGRDLERDLPFGVALQLFERPVAEAGHDRRAQLLSGSAALAAPLLCEGVPTSEGLSASLHGLYWLTANLAEDRPLLLLVDDMHWCDRPSLRFLGYLAQRINELPVSAIFGVAEGLAHGDDPLLDELRSHDATTVIRPRPLSEDAVGETLRQSLFPGAEPAFASACFEATSGNPLLLSELAVELAVREIQPRAKNAAIVHEFAPESIAAAVLVRLRSLDKGAPELARAVAVLGEPVELRHAAELAGLPLERASQLADALMGAGVLRRDQRLAFVHPVVRLAVHAERPEFDRAEAHRRAAELLIAEEAAVERVVPHLLAGRPNGDARAVGILMRAGESALRGGAPQSAIRLFRRALDEPPAPDVRPDVLVALGRAEGAAGAPEAIAHLTGALELIGDPVSRAAAALDTSRVLISHGRWEDAAATLRRGMEDIGDEDPALREQMDIALVTAAQAGGLERVPRTAPDPSDAKLEETPAGRLTLARAAADCALRGTSAAEVRELATRALGNGALLDSETSDGVGFHLAVFALVVAEELQIAELAATTAIDDARRRGSVLGFASASYVRSLALVQRGRVSHAAADALGALGARRYGWAVTPAGAASVAADCHLEEGDTGKAMRALETHSPADEELVPLDYRFLGARSRARLLDGAPAAALEDALRGGRLLQELGGDNPSVLPWRTLASAAALAMRDRTEARRLAEEEVELASAFGAQGAYGRALGALAAVTRGADGLELREQAVRALEDSQLALERARALADFGSALRRAGRRRQARQPLRLALDLAARCGGRIVAKRAKDELAVLGTRPRRHAASGREALTAREAQVAGLAAQGTPNREIAESLFITVKTVEWHLRHAYEKLGVRSRGDLVRALADRTPVNE